MFQHLKAVPPDPILGILAAYAADQNPNKMDLGTFRNDNNWIGRSLFADPLYNGTVSELKLLPF